jgi:AhpD family alkylhydroperoxidase
MSDESALCEKGVEFVALGASVGAGCRPCLKYHVNAARKAGIGEPGIRHAVDVALRIRRQASDDMARLADELLDGADPAEAPEQAPDATSDALIAIGAAFAAGSVPLLASCLAAARRIGTPEPKIQMALTIARTVKREAGKKVDKAADALVTSQTAAVEEPACGCGKHE